MSKVFCFKYKSMVIYKQEINLILLRIAEMVFEQIRSYFENSTTNQDNSLNSPHNSDE